MEDTPAEGQAICSACGAPLRPGAQFCGVCGAATEQRCSRCGTLLRQGASFCGSCGSRAGGPAPATPRSVRRRPIPPAAAIAGAAAAVAAAVFAGWFFFLRGDGPGGSEDGRPSDVQESAVTVVGPVAADAVDPSSGLPLRPGVRLEHPSGASAGIPGGPSLYGDAMDLRAIDLAEDPWWDHGGSGWEFVSFTGVPITGATVDIPAGESSGSVIVLGSSGLWFELPTEAVTLTTGKPGFRVAVDGISSPWTFAVATPKAGALEVTPEMKDAIHRDQLYWTGREAWQREAVDWYKARPLTTFPTGARVGLRAAPNPTGEFERIRVQVLDTYQLFALAGAGMTADLTVPLGLAPIPGIEATAQGLWAVGVAQLARTRDDWLAFRATLGEIESLAPDVAVAIGFMDQWIETAMHLYTPWGLDLVNVLLESGNLNGLDLRVLKPYGELKWADVTLKAGDVPAIDSHVADLLASEQDAFIAGAPGVQRTLRFYSVRALERLALIDWFKENVDWIVRWLPVALTGAGLIPGVLPAAVGLSFFFALVDQVINWTQEWYTAGSTSPYSYLAFEGASAGGAGGVSFMMDMWEERTLMSTQGRPMLTAHTFTIAQFAYSVGMFAAVRGTDWYLFKSIRDINEGTRGYCRSGRCASIGGTVPPVMVHVRAAGPLAQPQGAYRANVDRMMAYRLEYGSADFHSEWLIGRKGPNAPLADLPFLDYDPAGWPKVVQRTEPDFQVIRLTLPKSRIAPEVWGNRERDGTPLTDFKPLLLLEGPGGEAASIEIVAESDAREGESPDNFYFTALLTKAGEHPVPGEEFGPSFEGAAANQARMPGGVLMTTLQGTLRFEDERTKDVTFALDFTANPPKPIDPQSGKSPPREQPVPARAQFVEAVLSDDITGTYEIVSWSVGAGAPALLESYLQGRLHYSDRCVQPGTCTFGVYAVPNSEGGKDFDAEICGPDAQGSRYCDDLADSRPYKVANPDSNGLAPLVNDDFFKLDGPILTGSAGLNWAWNPGEPVEVITWHTVRAEFADGRVKATVIRHRIDRDVVDGKIVNRRESTLEISFEAVLRK